MMTIDRHIVVRLSSAESATVVRAVTVIMGTVVGLTFLFGFGNVLNLAIRLGVPLWVAPLVAPAVDLSIVGLLLATRYLAVAGAPRDVLLPARRLLIFASVVTLALNVAEPVLAGQYGKAAFDAVGPLLLIGWSEVGPGLLQAIGAASQVSVAGDLEQSEPIVAVTAHDGTPEGQSQLKDEVAMQHGGHGRGSERIPEALLSKARHEDAVHRMAHQKPISADTLRVRLGVGSGCARRLVKVIRAEFDEQLAAHGLAVDMAVDKPDEVIVAA